MLKNAVLYLLTHTDGSPFRGLVGVVSHVLHEGEQGRPGLLGGGEDLLSREQKAIAAGVPQLEGEGVAQPAPVGPVRRGAARRVCNRIAVRVRRFTLRLPPRGQRSPKPSNPQKEPSLKHGNPQKDPL